MSTSKLSTSDSDVSLPPTSGIKQLATEDRSTDTWRLEMPYLTMQSMMTMHYVPKLDRKLIRYGVSWIVAIATSMIGVVAYA